MKASGTCSQGVLLDSKTPNARDKTRYPHFWALQIMQKGFSRLTNKRTGDILCFFIVCVYWALGCPPLKTQPTDEVCSQECLFVTSCMPSCAECYCAE